MRRAVRSLMLLVAVLASVGAALPDPEPAAREDAVQNNLRVLERWRQDPEHAARLQRDLKHFWSLPVEQRRQLRKLDQELDQQDSPTQKRLWGILERYSAWVERLSPADRKRVNSVSGDERLAVIKDIHDQQWVRRQPPKVREAITALTGEKRTAEIARLREEQRQRHQDAMMLAGARPPVREKPSRLNEFPDDVQRFYQDSLRPLLSSEERTRLNKAEKQPWPTYARTLADLAGKHPIALPGPVGPVRISDLPFELTLPLRGKDRQRALRKEEGKWPDFLIKLLEMQPQLKRNPPQSLRRFMPSKPIDFSPAIQEFILQLEKKLSPDERARLEQARGRWPNYPERLLELARKYNLDIPGMTLPGPRELWDGARAALPEVPDGQLFHFAMTELSREEREQLALASGDPVVREKVKKAFFQKYPRELQRLQQLDFRGPKRGKQD